ncbi:Cocaine- and amphetamine-regulated transcript protein [Varanus komodoensis]|uniref:cocaine- and amphetamine-regulated transcript protein-like n=1 Tax=Varanus komodoensis TaxID=61221 RepID=UPI001CF7C474|nr:cocaine- and amphetamine-regulated transcript protein-like [Varanus komodoensis]KAF7238535.1 Cocaine- and amphetamine-regulated transcript protein [Varanus komodoensis]
MDWGHLGATVLLLCLVLEAQRGTAAAAGRAPQEFSFKHSYEKELLDELQEVLEKLQHKKVSTWEKKFNQVPKCSFGDACAVRKGARIGKLCDCPRGSACNAFFLKCL